MRASRLLLRFIALAALAAALVALPLVVFRAIGWPFPSIDELRTAWTARRVDSAIVIDIGASVFAVLWAWFAITALAEFRQVVTWRLSGSRGRLAPLPHGPSGWVRGLVRFVAVSAVSATATVSGLASTVTALTTITSPSRVVAVADSAAAEQVPDGATLHFARGRETPFSLATSLGSPHLRDQIIELNIGRATPDGDSWQGGVFPAGMSVLMPLAAPVEETVPTILGPAHSVRAGDSYWKIAEDHLSAQLQRDPTPQEVLDYTQSLISFNQPILGHSDPALIHPGELVVFTNATPLDDVAVVEETIVDTPADFTEVRDASPHRSTRAEADTAVAADDLVVETPRDVAAPPESAAPTARPEAAPSVDALELGSPLPYSAGLGAAVMLAGGALGMVEARRRRQLSVAKIGARLATPSMDDVRTERLLRSLDAGERLARLDVALRAAAAPLARQGASVLAALMHDTGEIRMFLRGSAVPDDHAWALDIHANTWCLSAHAALTDLAEKARPHAQPCPAMVHIGGTHDGAELYVDLEAVGTLIIRAPHAVPLLRSIAASVAVSPFLDTSTSIFTVGIGDTSLGAGQSEEAESLDAALDAAALSLGSTAALARGATTFGLRAEGAGGESWEPAIIVAADGIQSVLELAGDLQLAAAGGRGLGLVVACDPDTELPRDGTKVSWDLTFADGQHLLEPLGIVVQPVGLSDDDVQQVTGLVRRADAAFETAPSTPSEGPTSPSVDQFVERDWAVMVRVLGPVELVACDGTPAVCERSKAVELVVWLSHHRDRPTRAAARTALWDVDVRDATFANVVSDARRALARAIAPAEGEEWITRTLTEDLPLHRRVVTDAELLAARVEHARGLVPLDAIEVLRPGVELIGGLPFVGTGYLWTDAEGITTSLSLLALGAAVELANHYLAVGDIEGVFYATGQGLKVFSGHEELIALRMRAHSRQGDLAGVRSEWDSYERFLAADPWAATEPASKLVGLRRELLSVGSTPHADIG